MSTEVEIVDSIQKMQDVEQRLFNSLTSGSASGLSATQQNDMINEINEVAQSRTSLYGALLQYYKGQQSDVVGARQNLVDQKTVLGLFESQLNDAKKNYNALKTEADNKLRMVEINTYYGEKYKAYGGLMKILLLICAPILIVAVLSRIGLLPRMAASIISFIVVAIGGFIAVRRLLDIYSRDNMVFNEYNWEFDPSKVVLSEHDSINARDSTFSLDGLEADLSAMGCIDAECCTKGTSWDKKTGRCISVSQAAIAARSAAATTHPAGAASSSSTTGAAPSRNSAGAPPRTTSVVGTSTSHAAPSATSHTAPATSHTAPATSHTAPGVLA